MRWEKLSLRERSQLMNLYLKGGVLSLKQMKEHYNRFADGGDVDNNQSTPSQDFVASWLANRQEQFQDNFRNSGSTMVPYSLLPKSWSDKAAFKEYQNQLKNLRTVKQYDVLGETKFPNIPDEEFKAISKLTTGTGGAYNPSSHSIAYISPYPGTEVHELTHALNPNAQINAVRYGYKGEKLQESKQYHPYKDSAAEVYSRLMQFRYLNNLDPNKKYTADDIKEWRKKSQDTDIINRYSDEYLLHLLNNVASTKSSVETNGRKLAAFGGPLKDEYDNPDQYYDYITAEEAENMYDPETKHWSSRDPRTGMILKNPKHPTFGMAIREDQALGYTPFIDSSTGRYFTLRPEEYATAPNKITLRRANKLQDGGKAESSIRRDSVYHRRSLERFIKENPVVEGINTGEFVDWASDLAKLESSYRRDIKGTTNGKTLSGYNGWYGQKIPKEKLGDENYQHRKLFQHLKSLFNNTITKVDIEEAAKLGIKPGPLLAKYWNQGNRVNNFIRGGKDTTDGTGRTKVSEYGNDIKSEINYERYAMEPITDDTYVVKSGDNFFDIQKKVRVEGRVYGDGKDLIDIQDSTMRNKLKKGLLNIGDTIRLRPKPKASKIKPPKQDYTLGNPIWHPELYLPPRQ